MTKLPAKLYLHTVLIPIILPKSYIFKQYLNTNIDWLQLWLQTVKYLLYLCSIWRETILALYKFPFTPLHQSWTHFLQLVHQLSYHQLISYKQYKAT